MRKTTKEQKIAWRRDWEKKYRKEHPEKVKARREKYNKSPKGIAKAKEYNEKWNKQNPEKEEQRRKNFIERMANAKKLNPKEYYEKHQKWVKEHPEKTREYRRRIEHKLYNNNLNFRLSKILRSRIQAAIKKGHKCDHTIKILGCSVSEFKKHIESLWKENMTWANYGLYGWHIDHIKPCASFNLNDPEEQKICFHYTNMQPLWAKDNLKKNKW